MYDVAVETLPRRARFAIDRRSLPESLTHVLRNSRCHRKKFDAIRIRVSDLDAAGTLARSQHKSKLVELGYRKDGTRGDG